MVQLEVNFIHDYQLQMKTVNKSSLLLINSIETVSRNFIVESKILP